MDFQYLKDFLDEKVEQYHSVEFIERDPIQIPHRFTDLEDIEISGFFACILAWGNRKSIIKSCENLLEIMGNAPFDFVINHTESDFKNIKTKALHRTFFTEDFIFFVKSLKKIYTEKKTMESLFLLEEGEEDFYHALARFRAYFFSESPEHRSGKHIANTYKNSAAKRLMMFLRWMVRQDKKGVDFGLWKNISPRFLSIPLDVHTANVSRKLGLLHRKQNDWKAVRELDEILRKMDNQDPAKYDFALFGLGESEEI